MRAGDVREVAFPRLTWAATRADSSLYAITERVEVTYMGELLGPGVCKVLYLDADVVVQGDAAELADLALPRGALCAATLRKNTLGVKGVQVATMEQLTEELSKAIEAQKKGETVFIEALINQELGEPFRRDAMKKPVEVAGISKNDMCPQKGAA